MALNLINNSYSNIYYGLNNSTFKIKLFDGKMVQNRIVYLYNRKNYITSNGCPKY